MKDRLMGIDNDIGKNVRQDILKDFEGRQKELIKRKKRIVPNNEEIRERYILDINNINNQEFLPLLHMSLYGERLAANIIYKKFTKECLMSMDDQSFEKLMKMSTFIQTLLNLNKSTSEIYNFSKEKLSNKG